MPVHWTVGHLLSIQPKIYRSHPHVYEDDISSDNTTMTAMLPPELPRVLQLNLAMSRRLSAK